MDEASLMDYDAFTIAIGRLREAGEQGWLSATFTPKGRQHWTCETFATGRPDTLPGRGQWSLRHPASVARSAGAPAPAHHRRDSG